MAWIESHQELRHHPKTRKLSRLLDVSVAAVIGHLHCLWWWSLDYADDGDLSRYDPLDVALGAEWEGDPETFVAATIRVGFIDDDRRIHDWDEYAGRLMEQRRFHAARARRNRGLYNDDQLIKQVRARDGDNCRYCGTVVNWKDRKGPGGGTYDHIDPNAEPENSIENVVVACRTCNARKGKRTPEEAGMWLKSAVTGGSTSGQQQETVGDGRSTADNLPGDLPNRTVPNRTEPNPTGPENDPPPPPEGDAADAAESAGKGKPETPYRFPEFWEPWPKKVGRKQTVEQWKRLQLDDATIDAIVAALPVHAAGDKWRRGYIQEPHRWLRDRRWEDEVEPFQAETGLTVTGSGPSNGSRPPRAGMTLVAGRWMDLTRLASEDIRHIGTFQGEDEGFRATLDRLTGQPAPPGQQPAHPFDDLGDTGRPSGVIDVAFTARSNP